MLDFLPDWVRALMGCGLLGYIIYAGVKYTSKDTKKSEPNKVSEEKKES